ncbi:uncharacterized protein LOC133902410 [Phragmites australis]|uniref:uncharacterized protein LOC133902410 n=1 Tax=Phragmites australis TaxID=29695 RepID=UPI002D789105|nr:uncharacterized protein LOC133902410 [Phragmites australis]
MAMVQVGMGLGRVVLLVGAGLTAPTVLRSGKISDILGELQEILREKGADGDGGSVTADLAKQVNLLATEVGRFASRNVTVLQVDNGNGAVSTLVAPAAAVGAVSYCYMWWKGIPLSSLMFVTKRNMANAVASMTKHLEQVQSSLAAAKRHLMQRIQHVDDKLDQQKQISGQIRDEVTGARLKIKSIGSDMDAIKSMISGLDEKMDSIEAKQNYSCAAVSSLCRFIEDTDGRPPEHLEGLQQTVRLLGGNNKELPVLGFGQLLAIEFGNPGGGRMLQSTAVKTARLMLP